MQREKKWQLFNTRSTFCLYFVSEVFFIMCCLPRELEMDMGNGKMENGLAWAALSRTPLRAI